MHDVRVVILVRYLREGLLGRLIVLGLGIAVFVALPFVSDVPPMSADWWTGLLLTVGGALFLGGVGWTQVAQAIRPRLLWATGGELFARRAFGVTRIPLREIAALETYAYWYTGYGGGMPPPKTREIDFVIRTRDGGGVRLSTKFWREPTVVVATRLAELVEAETGKRPSMTRTGDALRSVR